MKSRITAAALIVLFTACSRQPSTGVSVDRKLAKYVPENAALVAGVDADSIRKSKFYERHKDVVNNFLSQHAQLNVEKDVHAGIVFEADGKTIGLIRSNATPPKSTKLEDDVVQLGGAQRVQSGTFPTPLAERLRLLASNDQIWFATTRGFDTKSLNRLGPNVTSALNNISAYISGANAGVALDDGVHFQADLTCDSEAGAQQVQQALRGIIAFGRLMTKSDQKDLLEIYRAIRVTQDRTRVHVQADLSPELSDKAAAYLTTSISRPR